MNPASQPPRLNINKYFIFHSFPTQKKYIFNPLLTSTKGVLLIFYLDFHFANYSIVWALYQMLRSLDT